MFPKRKRQRNSSWDPWQGRGVRMSLRNRHAFSKLCDPSISMQIFRPFSPDNYASCSVWRSEEEGISGCPLCWSASILGSRPLWIRNLVLGLVTDFHWDFQYLTHPYWELLICALTRVCQGCFLSFVQKGQMNGLAWLNLLVPAVERKARKEGFLYFKEQNVNSSPSKGQCLFTCAMLAFKKTFCEQFL